MIYEGYMTLKIGVMAAAISFAIPPKINKK